jgi:hypothetical protein
MRALSGAAGAAGAVASAALGYGLFVEPRRAITSYLFAFIYVLTIVVGALFLLMIGHVCNASWFVPLRRQCERVVLLKKMAQKGL